MLSSVAMGCVIGVTDLFRLREESSISRSSKESLPRSETEKIKRIFLSGEKKEPAPSLSNLKNFLQDYRKLSPREAGHTLLEQAGKGSELYRFSILDILACRLGEASPDEARLLLDECEDREQQAELAEGLIKGWARTDWEGAMAYLLSHRDKSYAEGTFEIIAQERTRSNPEEVITWLASQSEEVRSAGLMPVMQELAENHPESVSRFVSSVLRPGDLGDVYLVDLVAGSFPKSDWETAMKWFNSLDDIMRREYANSAYGAFAEADYVKTTEEYHKGGDSYFAGAVVKELTKRSPFQAMQWVEQNIKEEKTGYISSIAGDRASQTPEFSAFVAQMPAGETKDACLRAMMYKRSRIQDDSVFSMEGTMSLASGISDETERIKTLEGNLNLWIKEHPDKVRRWVQTNSDLSGTSKADYIRRCDSLMKENRAQ